MDGSIHGSLNNMKIKDKNIVIIGLGYVGLTLAVILAECGFKIYGYEKNTKIKNKLKKMKPHFYEPGLSHKLRQLMEQNKIEIIDEITDKNSFNSYIVTVGTPLKRNKTPDLLGIISATNLIAKNMNNNSLIIYRSTIPPRTSEKIILPILNKSKNKFDYCYCPERTAQGIALVELKNMPQIIGGSTLKAIKRSKSIFNKVTKKIKIVSDITTAEMIKCVDNTQRDVKFAYANEIAKICNLLKINSDEVLRSANYEYPRTSLFLPGPVGGPCLSKDSYLLLSSIDKKEVNDSVILSSRKTNENLLNIFFKYLKNYNKFNNKKLHVLLLGLTFKGHPKTDDIRGSISIELINLLRKNYKIAKIYSYDPYVKKDTFEKYKLINLNKIDNSFYNKDLVIFANNNPKFHKLNLKKEMKLLNKNSLVYDFWNFFKKNYYYKYNNSNYISYGSQK
mgnify:CR=1 FL=1|tara:strand:- start:2059 stop:3405 length:1347 start_codon:yes stop_codon:yes gene_type:complete